MKNVEPTSNEIKPSLPSPSSSSSLSTVQVTGKVLANNAHTSHSHGDEFVTVTSQHLHECKGESARAPLASLSHSHSPSSFPVYFAADSLDDTRLHSSSSSSSSSLHAVGSFEIWHCEPKLAVKSRMSSSQAQNDDEDESVGLFSKKKGMPKRAVLHFSVDKEDFSLSYKLIAAKNFSNRNNIKQYERCHGFACGRLSSSVSVAACSLLDNPEHAARPRPLTRTTLSRIKVRPKLIAINSSCSSSSDIDQKNPPFLLSTGRRDKPGGTCVIIFASSPNATVRLHSLDLDEPSIRVQCTNFHMNAHADNDLLTRTQAPLPLSALDATAALALSKPSKSSPHTTHSRSHTPHKKTKSASKRKREVSDEDDDDDDGYFSCADDDEVAPAPTSSTRRVTRKRVLHLPLHALQTSESDDSLDEIVDYKPYTKRSKLTNNVPSTSLTTPATVATSVKAEPLNPAPQQVEVDVELWPQGNELALRQISCASFASDQLVDQALLSVAPTLLSIPLHVDADSLSVISHGEPSATLPLSNSEQDSTDNDSELDSVDEACSIASSSTSIPSSPQSTTSPLSPTHHHEQQHANTFCHLASLFPDPFTHNHTDADLDAACHEAVYAAPACARHEDS